MNCRQSNPVLSSPCQQMPWELPCAHAPLRAQAAAKEATWVDLKHTTSVYVQGLPDDVTEAEMVQARPAK